MQNVDRDGYGITVNGIHSRPILPEKVVDVGRFDVRINPEGSIEGGVLCTNVEATGTPFSVRGSLLALGSGTFVASPQGVGVIQGPVMVNESLLMESSGGRRTSFRIVGDVSAKKVRLENVVIFGNLFGNNISLKNCLIFGAVNATSQLRLDNSLCFTFLGNEVSIDNRVMLLNCSASANQKLEIKGKVLSLAFNLWDRKQPESGEIVELGSEDMKNVACEKENGSRESKIILSCFDRIFDVTKLGKFAAENINWVEDHLIRIVDDQSGELAIEVEAVFHPLFD